MASDSAAWAPPATIGEMYEKMGKQEWSAINRPVSGALTEKALAEGSAPLQLYSLNTPNGQKVGLMMEELGVEYDAHYTSILKGDQFTSGFVGVNPNSKIPALVDKEGPGGKPINVWETANIVLYLAEKYNKFLPTNPVQKVEMMNWVFWQMGGQGPMTGQFGHFFAYAPKEEHAARNYGCARYGMEVQRLSHVLDTHLAGKDFILGSEFTIADICCFPWVRWLARGGYKVGDNNSQKFLEFDQYKNLNAWLKRIEARPATARGLQVCSDGVGKPWLEKQEQ